MNAFYFSLYNIKYSRFDILIFKGLNESPFFSYNWQIYCSEISSIIKQDCVPVSNKIRTFSLSSLSLELIKASVVCNRITLFSALQKFTELDEIF